MQVEAIAGALGAEIKGVDLSSELSNSDAAAIRDAFLDHKVIFFRDQELTPKDQVRFAWKEF